MKNKDILITINNLEDILKLKELGITKYVFPLKHFCVGIPNTFLVSEINVPGYIYVNRILDNDGIDKLREILLNLPSNIIGIIFDDLGIIELVKDLKLEKILYLTHFNTNKESVNIYLDFVDTVILSSDNTMEELEYITNHVNKKVVLNIFGFIGVMYSRRLLIDNYVKFYKVERENPLIIKNDNHEFLVYENEYGTYFYNNKIFNGLDLLKLDAKYYFINAVFLDIKDIENILHGNLENMVTDKGFLYKETIYKLGDKDV